MYSWLLSFVVSNAPILIWRSYQMHWNTMNICTRHKLGPKPKQCTCLSDELERLQCMELVFRSFHIALSHSKFSSKMWSRVLGIVQQILHFAGFVVCLRIRMTHIAHTKYRHDSKQMKKKKFAINTSVCWRFWDVIIWALSCEPSAATSTFLCK